MEQIEELRDQLQQALIKLQVSEELIAKLSENKFQNENMAEEDEDIETDITSGDQIQLESYKSV